MRIDADWLRAGPSQQVLSLLEDRGFQAYFVGGCVRNALLRQPVADLDIATSATPEQVIAAAGDAGLKVIPTGVEHGTVTVMIGDHPFEVTTFRKDVETFGRRAVVAFAQSIEEDARRRDFTMNALYADKVGVIVDPLNGMPDLLDRRVRFIEDANTRIQEDFLRSLRFFRFHAWYGDPAGGMDPDALAAIADNLDGLDTLSKERVGAEIRKTLSAVDPAPAVAAMEATGVLTRLLPVATTTVLPVIVHLEQSLGLTSSWQRRLISLGAQDVIEALRLSNADGKRIQAYHTANDKMMSDGEAAYRFGRETALDLCLMRAAGLGVPVASDDLRPIETGAGAVFPVSAADLPSTLHGKAIGDRLKALESDWIASGFVKSKADLLV